MKHISSYY